MTNIICAECGQGHYYNGLDLSTGRTIWAMCDECGHEIAESDLSLEADEIPAWDLEGRLSYVIWSVA